MSMKQLGTVGKKIGFRSTGSKLMCWLWDSGPRSTYLSLKSMVQWEKILDEESRGPWVLKAHYLRPMGLKGWGGTVTFYHNTQT